MGSLGVVLEVVKASGRAQAGSVAGRTCEWRADWRSTPRMATPRAGCGGKGLNPSIDERPVHGDNAPGRHSTLGSAAPPLSLPPRPTRTVNYG